MLSCEKAEPPPSWLVIAANSPTLSIDKAYPHYPERVVISVRNEHGGVRRWGGVDNGTREHLVWKQNLLGTGKFTHSHPWICEWRNDVNTRTSLFSGAQTIRKWESKWYTLLIDVIWSWTKLPHVPAWKCRATGVSVIVVGKQSFKCLSWLD